MKKFTVLLISTLISCSLKAQSPIGAWESNSISENGDKLRSVVIFAEGYQVLSIYNETNGKFIHANGGTWTLKGDVMTERTEFNTDKAERVGTEVSFKIAMTDDSLIIVGSNMKLRRIDSGKPGVLQGAWLMSGRISEGKEQLRDISGPRKTMKILSGTRFQWIAYNTETKQFLGTGGGTYTTNNGEYAENIEFFSRDDSKAGLSLKFHYEMIGDKWHHTGLSSKGDSIHEVWSIRK